MGDREVVIARELTKIYEEFIRGHVTDLIERLKGRQIKGEVVLLVAPAPAGDEPAPSLIVDLLRESPASGEVSLKDAVQRVALETGQSRGAVYVEALRLKRGL